MLESCLWNSESTKLMLHPGEKGKSSHARLFLSGLEWSSALRSMSQTFSELVSSKVRNNKRFSLAITIKTNLMFNYC